jgi:hypothetical protein
MTSNGAQDWDLDKAAKVLGNGRTEGPWAERGAPGDGHHGGIR